MLATIPRVLASTYALGVLYLIFWILSIALILGSFFLFLSLGLNWEKVIELNLRALGWHEQKKLGREVSVYMAWLLLGVGILFGALGYLSRMVLKRNHLILTLQDWVEEEGEKVRMKSKTKR